MDRPVRVEGVPDVERAKMVLFASYVCSAMAMRFYGHASFVMSMPVASPERQALNPLAALRRDQQAGLQRARRYRAGWAQLTEAVLQALPAHQAPYLQVQWAVEAIGTEAAMSDPTLFTLGKLCRPPPAPGSARQVDCDRWAQSLIEQGDTLMAQMTGLRLGELAGWPPERTEPQRQALSALSHGSTAVFDAEQPYGCAGVQRIRRWALQVAREGEVATLRAMAAASAPR